MNEFFNLAAKIAYDNRIAAKEAGEKWDKIKAAASKAGEKAKTIAKNPHFQKGAASAATGTVAGIIGKKSGMSGKGALGLGVGVAAGTDAALEGGSALTKAVKARMDKIKAARAAKQIGKDSQNIQKAGDETGNETYNDIQRNMSNEDKMNASNAKWKKN